jgi:hypothetical protein
MPPTAHTLAKPRLLTVPKLADNRHDDAYFPIFRLIYYKSEAKRHDYLKLFVSLHPIEQLKRTIMEQVIGLNAAQREFLQLLGRIKTKEELDELRKVVCEYYARKIDKEMDQLWADGKWDNEKNEAILKEHLRTPYKYAK